MTRATVSFGVGFVFAVGLAIAGMTRPAKVIGFLDIFGQWDPSLVWVMGGALVTLMVLRAITRKTRKPIFDLNFHLPRKRKPDRRLLVGSLLFGIGWGLVGFCPGPALASIATLEAETLILALAMLGGMTLYSAWEKQQERTRQ